MRSKKDALSVLFNKNTTKKLPIETIRSIWSTFKYLKVIASLVGIEFYDTETKLLRAISIGYTLLMFCVSLLFAVQINIFANTKMMEHFNSISKTVYMIQYYLGFFTLMSVYYQAFFHRHNWRRVEKYLVRIEKIFHLHLDSVHFRKVGILCQYLFIEVVLFTVIIFGLYLARCVESGTTIPLEIIATYFSTIYPIIVTYLTMCKFLNLCWVLHAMFRSLGECCTKLCLKREASQLDNQLNFGLFIVIKECPTADQFYMKQLKMISQIYGMLFNAIELLNIIFGMSNLTTVAQCSISVIGQLFLIFKLLMKGKADDLNEFIDEILCWLFFFVAIYD